MEKLIYFAITSGLATCVGTVIYNKVRLAVLSARVDSVVDKLNKLSNKLDDLESKLTRIDKNVSILYSTQDHANQSIANVNKSLDQIRALKEELELIKELSGK